MFKVDLYTAIYTRRDVRSFRTDPVPDSLLIRILDAAHHAGSVGFMQPWNFVVVRSPDLKKRVFDSFARRTPEPPRTMPGSGGHATIR